MKSWFRSLALPPAPLTPRERIVAIVVMVVAGVTRFAAVAMSPWDWDEMLFIMGMRHYDVSWHHPHPPGFPLWIAAADLLHLFGISEFRSLQAITVVGAIAIVPAAFFLFRELRMRVSTAIGAAALLAFFPNVWLYGGTALSDVPSMTLVILAVALLVRGCRDRRAYYAGAVVLAVAAGFRPQNLLIGCAPALLASACRKPRDLIGAALLGAVIVGASYGVAIEKTGWDAYRFSVQEHSEYITKIDSYRSPIRPPLWRVFVEFFVRPYRMPLVNVAITLFATIAFVAGTVKRRPHIIAMEAAFGPFCIFAWLMLDHFSASRFSIGYAPIIAVFAADGVALVVRLATLEALVDGALIAVMIGWSWPALRVVRTTVAPPVAALHWVETHVARSTPLYVHGSLAPYADVYLHGYSLLHVTEPPRQGAKAGPTPLFLIEAPSDVPGAMNFVREHGHLWWIVRQRYFEVSIQPVAERVRMLSGWYGEESLGTAHWRWMGARSTTELPPMPAGHAHLRLSLYVPLDTLPSAPTVSVTVNGTSIAQVHATSSQLVIERDVALPPGAWSDLVITTDRTVQPPGDTRTLGLRLDELVVWP